MPKIIIKLNNEIIKEQSLAQGIVIGRETGDVVLKNPAVSAKHARIAVEKNHYILHDLQSTNGTFVNRGRVTTRELHHGDVINIGKFEMEFINEEEKKQATSDFFGGDMGGMTVMIDAEEMMKAQKAREEAKKEKIAELFDVTRSSAGSSGVMVIHRLEKETTLIGSGDTVDIKTPGITIASVAAAIVRSGAKYSLRFMGGFSKPKVNGEKVSGDRELKSKDRIELGNYIFEIRL